MKHRLIEGKKIIGGYGYEMTVEHTSFFGRSYVQVYRGPHWRLYPQGRKLAVFGWEWPFHDWLDEQCQQYEWSREHI